MFASFRIYERYSQYQLEAERLLSEVLTTEGALPPSSKMHGLRCFAASEASILPTRSLPVN